MMRFLILVCCALSLLVPDFADAARAARKAPPRWGVNDPRYAALIMNPKTGEVYHSANADARRYPASLTKMMTLYLLFEALEARKVSLGTRMKVSDYASVQPQTNISLRTTDTVPVETAIKALVIRSANDVAVVVAEHLGGSVPNFATLMTRKARELGMRNTVFKNPNGLPNGAQYTTARDMAKLGIALKRDFPNYYQYFAARQFSWKGVTYYTHNRVMLRYAGTDGIKTGFINASGFNVVTSTERGGRPLVGVVMGGASGQWRDDRMIALLDAAYATIAKRGQKRGVVVAANLPSVNGREAVVPIPAKAPEIKVAVATPPAPVAAAAKAPIAAKPVQLTEPKQAPAVVSAPPVAQQAPVAVVPATPAPQVVAPTPAPPPNTLDAQLAARQQETRADAGVENMWGIQVGAFSTRLLAERAALQAYQLAQGNLKGSRIAVLGSGPEGAQVHRARLENINEKQAKKACEMLISNNSPCFIYRSGAL
jgi:D-alanyl-D-alanine carboxypeptidase